MQVNDDGHVDVSDSTHVKEMKRSRQIDEHHDTKKHICDNAETTAVIPNELRRHKCVRATIPDPALDDTRIVSVKAVIYPQLLMEEIPLTAPAVECVKRSRRCVSSVFGGEDDRLVVIVGPCSIHDPVAAKEYAGRLRDEANRLEEDLVILMRVYFEKPRTTIGWKGLINDPYLNETFDTNHGLKISRQLLCDINALGLPCACEWLDTMTPQYLADCVSWGAIGARTTESQLHRELASGLSMPIGFKNGTSGNIQTAIDAIRSASYQHSFMSITKQGLPAIVLSLGNKDTHIVLRGGSQPNYSESDVEATISACLKQKVTPKLMIDCSHGNSQKMFKNQRKVVESICEQLSNGQENICGAMIESHLFEGSQSIPSATEAPRRLEAPSRLNTADFCQSCGKTLGDDSADILQHLRYGVSVTDGCVGWDETVELLQKLAEGVRKRRLKNVRTQTSSAIISDLKF